MQPKHNFLRQPRPHLIAHRGGNAAGAAKLNTLAAFQSALNLGYKYIETDVVVTTDGKLVIYHGSKNRWQQRKTNQHRRKTVQEMTYAQVKKHVNPGGEPVPLLEDALAAFPETLFNIDAKTKQAVRPLADAIRRTGSIDRVCVASFSYKRTLAVAELLGGQDKVCTSIGPAGFAAYFVHSKMRSAFMKKISRLKVGCLQLPSKFVTKDLLRAAHGNGLMVHVWTVNEPDTMSKMLGMGVDGIVTDETETLAEVANRSK